MDDLAALLDSCRSEAGATVAALVGRDGLLIERTEAAAAAASLPEPDLLLAGAEATDLFTVADRLLMDAFAAGEAQECWLAARAAGVYLARLHDGAFTVLLLPAESEPARARTAVGRVRNGLEAGLA